MRNSRCILAALVMAFGLSACAPDGYVETPVLSGHFNLLAPSAFKDGITEMAVCSDSQNKWFATVFFADESMYHYSISSEDPTLVRSTTAKQRKVALEEQDIDIDLACIGHQSFGGFQETGTYRFKFSSNRVKSYVLKTVVFNYPFNEVVLGRMKRAALAIEKAVQDHRKYEPSEISWGVMH